MASLHTRARCCTKYAALVTCLVMCTTTWTATAVEVDGWEVKLVQVVHRHGARSPIVAFNESVICRTAPCGHLNEPGKQMMLNAGRYLRERYNNGTAAVDYFPAEYNVSQIYSRSTDVLRTLQSASAVLEGLFTPSEPSDRLYAVHAERKATDALLSSHAHPHLFVVENVQMPEYFAYCNIKADELFSFDEITELAREAHMEGFCSNWTRRSVCLKKLRGSAESYAATGELSEFPVLRGAKERLTEFTMYANSFWYSYNREDSEQKRRGSYGANLATQIVKNLRDRVNRTINFLLMHYSAHDTTLSPLSSALGDSTPRAMAPPYGGMYIFELLFNAKGDDNSMDSWAVRIFLGQPSVTPESGYVFSAGPFDQMHCMHQNGSIYMAANATCPLLDFERFIQTSLPQDEAGPCYLSGELRRAMSCPVDGTDDVPNDVCAFHRSQCPDQACESGYFLDTTSTGWYRCRGMTQGVYVGSALGLTGAALVLGMILATAVQRIKIPGTVVRKNGEGYTVLQSME